MGKEPIDTDEVLRGALAISVLTALVCAAPTIGLGWFLWSKPRFISEVGTKKLMSYGSVIIVIGVGFWLLCLSDSPVIYLPSIHEKIVGNLMWRGPLRLLVSLWWCGSGAVLMLAPLFEFIRPRSKLIRVASFEKTVKNFKSIAEVFKEIDTVPIGIDLNTGKVMSLYQKRRISHVIVYGATGSGKSTLLINMFSHSIYHNQPCIVIDPKGEDSTLNTVIRIGRDLSPTFDKRFKLFSLAKPNTSAYYNPIKHGNANELKDRMMEAFNWSEQYYQSIAGEFLSVFCSVTEYLEIPLTIDLVALHLSHKEEQSALLTQLHKKAAAGDKRADRLFMTLSSLFKRLKPDDLAGLHAQLSILNNPTIGHLLSFDKAEVEINLCEALEKNQIIYFQLPILGNADTSRRLGRMIIEDIKALSAYVYQRVPNEDDRKFCSVFLDEFGSFASKEFIELLKQARAAKIAVHLFTQGHEDLDVVSPEFGRQTGSNPLTKIVLRLDDEKSVNAVCSMAGTVDALEKSYQVENTFTWMKTGMGNMRETKQMRVEHDAVKNLNNGQAVVIEKSPSRVVALQVQPLSVFDELFPEK